MASQMLYVKQFKSLGLLYSISYNFMISFVLIYSIELVIECPILFKFIQINVVMLLI